MASGTFDLRVRERRAHTGPGWGRACERPPEFVDLSFTPEEEAFAAEVREWLATNLEPPPPFASVQDEVEWGRRWQARLAEARWGGIHLPRGDGGRGGPAGRGQRPRLAVDEGDAGGGRLGAVGAEGVDVVRAVRPVGDLSGPHRPRRAEASRDLVSRRRHVRAGGRRAAARAAHRRGGVQR